MDCPNCQTKLQLPPEPVLKQMSNIISRRCPECCCHLRLNQETEGVEITYNPEEEDD